MDCFDGARGILKYLDTRYLYFSDEIPENLWEMVIEKLNPLKTNRMLLPVKGEHCQYCRFKSICQRVKAFNERTTRWFNEWKST